MRLLDSRRLTGPNLIWERPGAVIDISFGEHNPGLVIGAWETQARRLLDEVGWRDEQLCVRRFQGGASCAISAPVDNLYVATEINEAAWDAARDMLDSSQRQLLQRVARGLREEARADERPRLRRLMDAARQHGVPVVLDTECVSLGLGRHSATWDLYELPAPDEVDWATLAPVPVALVTGTNGKTTTVRLMDAIGQAAGLVTGVSTTDWLAVGGTVIERDDYAGPEGARRILRDPNVELAVLETARGGLLRRGLSVEHADAALITNIAADHIGEFGVQNLEELADVKWVVTRALDAGSTLVLNADDPLLVARAPSTRARLIWFSANPRNALLQSHLAAGGTVVTLNRGRIVVKHRAKVLPVATVKQIPICLGGRARHNVINALGATALAHALALPADAIGRGLCAMRGDQNPGRANLFLIDGVQVLLDFAHNPAGLAALMPLVEELPAGRRLLVIGQAGDRSDHDIRDFALAAGAGFERILVKRLDSLARGRPAGEAARQLRATFREMGYSAGQIGEHRSEPGALRAALRWAKPGDLVLFLAHTDRDAILTELGRLQADSD